MNTPVSFELAKLLKEKGFKPTKLFGYISKFYNPNTETLLAYGRTGRIDLSKAYFAPTIAEVVMWLYEEYDVWIHAMQSFREFTPYIQCDWNYRQEAITDVLEFMKKRFKTPTEAYEAAIEYTLKNLIN